MKEIQKGKSNIQIGANVREDERINHRTRPPHPRAVVSKSFKFFKVFYLLSHTLSVYRLPCCLSPFYLFLQPGIRHTKTPYHRNRPKIRLVHDFSKILRFQ